MRMDLGAQNAEETSINESLQRSPPWIYLFRASSTTEEASSEFFHQLPNAFRHVSHPRAYGAFAMNPVKKRFIFRCAKRNKVKD